MRVGLVGLMAGALLSAGLVAAGPAAARCAEEFSYAVDEVGGAEYAHTAPATGQYNDSPETSTLAYEISTTTSRATTWAVDAGAEVGWAIWKVEAHTKFDVTNVVERGVKVSSTLPVPAKHHGYVHPKVQIRHFHITMGRVGGDCRWHQVKDYGVLAAITGWPFFATCVAEGPCLPKP